MIEGNEDDDVSVGGMEAFQSPFPGGHRPWTRSQPEPSDIFMDTCECNLFSFVSYGSFLSLSADVEVESVDAAMDVGHHASYPPPPPPSVLPTITPRVQSTSISLCEYLSHFACLEVWSTNAATISRSKHSSGARSRCWCRPLQCCSTSICLSPVCSCT